MKQTLLNLNAQTVILLSVKTKKRGCNLIYIPFFRGIGKNVQNGKTEQTPKASFGVWIPESVWLYAERRSFFVTKMAFVKKKILINQDFLHSV